MIFYYDVKNSITDQAHTISVAINNEITEQEKKLKTLLESLKSFKNIIINNEKLLNSEITINLLKNFVDNFESLKMSLSNLKSLSQEFNKLSSEINRSLIIDSQINGFLSANLTKELEHYNTIAKQYNDNSKQSNNKFDKFFLHYVEEMSIITQTSENQSMSLEIPNSDSQNTDISSEIDIDEDFTDNHSLIISEIHEKVYLPYRISDLKEQLEQSKDYSTLQDIIANQYIVPLKRYKNDSISRFREAYRLMKEKENASTYKSLELALELTFNNLLNPAIISACRNLDELDIYLDCLCSNELDQFNLFEIKYELI